MSDPVRATDLRLDALMEILLVLHETGVITDPAISSTRRDDCTEVTVEFLLDYDRARVGAGTEQKNAGRK